MSDHEADVVEPDHGATRRRFLAGAAGAATALAAASSLTPSLARAQESTQASAADKRTFASRAHTLELDGVSAGALRSAEGGHAVGEVVVDETSLSYYSEKHIVAVRYEDFTVQAGPSLDRAFAEWIEALFSGSPERRSGAIASTESNGQQCTNRAFENAALTEIAFPKCDASSRDAGFLTVTFSPESTETTKCSGATASISPKQKAWLTSNYRLEIDKLDCTRVLKIESFTIKQKAVDDPVGGERSAKGPGKIEFPNLVVSLSAVSAASWEKWFQDFVLDGNNSEEAERSGTLSLLTADRKEVLATVGFHGLGIYRLAADGPGTGSEAVRDVRAEMYCERMSFSVGKPASGSEAAP